MASGGGKPSGRIPGAPQSRRRRGRRSRPGASRSAGSLVSAPRLASRPAASCARSKDAAVGAEDRHQVLADRGQRPDGLLPAVAKPVQVRGHLIFGQAGGAGDLQRGGPRRDRGGPVRGGRQPGHTRQLRRVRYQASDDLVDGQLRQVFRRLGRQLGARRKPGPFRIRDLYYPERMGASPLRPTGRPRGPGLPR